MTSRARKRFFKPTSRAMLWLPFRATINSLGSTGITTAQLQTNYFSDTGEEIPVGTTVTRVRGLYSVVCQAIAVRQAFNAALALVPEGGYGTIPSLASEIFDAFWYLAGRTSGEVSETAAGVFGAVDTVYPIDTKGKRKIKEVGEEITLIVQNTAGSIIDVQAHGYMLLQLP